MGGSTIKGKLFEVYLDFMGGSTIKGRLFEVYLDFMGASIIRLHGRLYYGLLWCTFFDKRIVENGWLGGSSIL